MDPQNLSTSPAPEVVIEQIEGSLQLKGWDRPEVSVKANPGDLDLREQDDVVHLSCRGNCAVRLPEAATVKIGSVHGDAHLKLLEDALTIDEVHGSLMLRNVADTSVESVHGNLLAKHILGSLRIESLAGNANVRDVQGSCLLDEVDGNLDLRDVEGNIQTSVDGNARLRLDQVSGDSYQIEARGNVDCRLPEDASLDVRLTSEGESIKVKLPNETKNIQGPEYQLRMGDGGVPFSISAGGVIFLSAQEPGPEEREEDYGDDMGFGPSIGRQIEAQIEAQMENLNRQLSEQMANLNSLMGRSGLSPEEAERIMQRARETGERAAARSQEKMRRAQEKLERKLEAARRRSEMKAQAADRRSQARTGRRSWGTDWPSPPPPTSAKEPVSDEERLAILRMLEQKKITIEEAEQLLAALEGRES